MRLRREGAGADEHRIPARRRHRGGDAGSARQGCTDQRLHAARVTIRRSCAPPTTTRRSPSSRWRSYSETRSLREVSTIADQQIVKRLQNAYGVGNIIRRRRGEAAGADLPAARCSCRRYRVGVDQVIAAIQAANQDLPAGNITRGAQRTTRARRRQDQGSARLRADHRREPGRRAGVPAPGRAGRRRRGGRRVDLARQRQAFRVALHLKVQQANVVEVGKGVDEARRGAASSACPSDIQISNAVVATRSGSRARSIASRARSSKARC